jgi:hypothetical protein
MVSWGGTYMVPSVHSGTYFQEGCHFFRKNVKRGEILKAKIIMEEIVTKIL